MLFMQFKINIIFKMSLYETDYLVLLDTIMEYEGARQTVESKKHVKSLDATNITSQDIQDWLRQQKVMIPSIADLNKVLAMRDCEYQTRTHIDIYRKRIVCTVHKFPGIPTMLGHEKHGLP